MIGPFNLDNEFFDKRELTMVIFTKVLLAQVGRLYLSVFGSEGHDSEFSGLGLAQTRMMLFCRGSCF